jgi:hypothetical protein
MRTFALIVIIVLSGCQSPKKDTDFTFFKWNIRETYYLKFNSSDTLYYIGTYPFEEQTSFTILSDEEKNEIENILDTITFPKNDTFENNSIEDGETYAFVLKNKKQSENLKIHGHSGPNQFWLFGKSLEEIKCRHKFTKINREFDLSEVSKMYQVPPPPIIGK